MNLIDLSNRLLEQFRHDLSDSEVGEMENLIQSGDAWLAVYDLITWAIDSHRDIRQQDLQSAAQAAELGAYGKLSKPLLATLRDAMSTPF